MKQKKKRGERQKKRPVRGRSIHDPYEGRKTRGGDSYHTKTIKVQHPTPSSRPTGENEN